RSPVGGFEVDALAGVGLAHASAMALLAASGTAKPTMLMVDDLPWASPDALAPSLDEQALTASRAASPMAAIPRTCSFNVVSFCGRVGTSRLTMNPIALGDNRQRRQTWSSLGT